MSIVTTEYGDGLEEFVNAYVPEDFLDMQEAMALATERDEQAAFELAMSIPLELLLEPGDIHA